MLAMTVSCAAIYSLMFAVGGWIYGRIAFAAALTSVSVAAGLLLIPVLHRLNPKSKGDYQL